MIIAQDLPEMSPLSTFRVFFIDDGEMMGFSTYWIPWFSYIFWSSWFPPRSVLPISLWPWQNSWSWFHRKVTRSSDVIFRGRLFVPSPSNPSNLITLSPWRHHRTATPRDFTKQSASPWNYGTFWMFRSFSLGCITRRKGIKKASCRNGTRLLVLLCFLGCQTLIRGCNFWSHFECHATDSAIIRTRYRQSVT